MDDSFNVNDQNNYKSIHIRHKITKQDEINKGKTSYIKVHANYVQKLQ